MLLPHSICQLVFVENVPCINLVLDIIDDFIATVGYYCLSLRLEATNVANDFTAEKKKCHYPALARRHSQLPFSFNPLNNALD